MSRTAEIRALARHDEPAALGLLSTLLSERFGLQPGGLAINRDQYSLNSLNGFFEAAGAAYFFKFHQEEGEEEMRGEYYRAEILEKAGLPIDMPVYKSVEPGEQILIYRRRSDARFSDVLLGLDLVPDAGKERLALDAEADLNRQLLAVCCDSLHAASPAKVASEPIHRLFHERLVDPATDTYPGGRLKSFYVGQDFAFPGAHLGWADLSVARIRVNGVAYEWTIGEMFDRAHDLLKPANLARSGAVIAHGDAHNANVWYETGGKPPRLVFFDPAFAGHHVPALLAEIKSTFHNILAHPFWLYDPALAREHFSAEARFADGTLDIRTNHRMSRIREGLLAVKAETFWRPWLGELKDRCLLQDDWRAIMRAALFCCPTLVMNLRAGVASHNAVSSAIALAVATMCGSEPESGTDVISTFLDGIDPA